MVKWSFKLWILETLKFFDLPTWVTGVTRLINISRDYDVKPQVQTFSGTIMKSMKSVVQFHCSIFWNHVKPNSEPCIINVDQLPSGCLHQRLIKVCQPTTQAQHCFPIHLHAQNVHVCLKIGSLPQLLKSDMSMRNLESSQDINPSFLLHFSRALQALLPSVSATRHGPTSFRQLRLHQPCGSRQWYQLN